MKKIRKEQIVQLREHDLNRGHNRSQTPVYPITVPESIEGLAEYLSKAGIAGTTTVDELPASGEEGKIYYNTSNGKYYTWSGTHSEFSQVVTANDIVDPSIPIISTSGGLNTIHPVHTAVYIDPMDNTKNYFVGSNDDFDAGGTRQGDEFEDTIADTQGFYLEPNKFYKLGTISAETDSDVLGGLRLYCVHNSTSFVKEYMGTFTVDMGQASSFNLICRTDNTGAIVVPDDTPDFEDGHTYEFNISASVLAIKDITYTGS